MPDFRRYYIQNAIIFITCVTHQRIPYLKSDDNLRLFWETLRCVQTIHPFRLLAYVILPDHFHWLLQINKQDNNFSIVLQSFKRNFTVNYKKRNGIEGPLKIWQNRFWDHIIRDENDLNKHFDYIHWNPVKHGYAALPEHWKESTFSHWQSKGYYNSSLGVDEIPIDIAGMNFE